MVRIITRNLAESSLITFYSRLFNDDIKCILLGIFLGILVMIIVVIIIFINITVIIFLIIQNVKMWRPSSFGILSIALADLLFVGYSIFRLGTTAFYFIDENNISSLTCIIMRSIGTILYCLTLFTPVAVAVDRYIAVCHPIKYFKWNKSGMTKRIFICCWIISTLFGCASFAKYIAESKNDYDYLCLPKVMETRDVVAGCVMQVICILMIVILYVRIFKAILKQVTKRQVCS